ncbi:tetratricopeptide repeat protein [Aeromicrobium sp. Leaf350]|uniref:tetratricopeptide repeat protein n=1 Tax=Aeromicrobium sp. Leaf350 TaxID=2876565 RepID=UPI001E2E76CC|nr:tetratricopeptide repeat protein [Aeromicrobium sp. Leaf350]
MVDSRPGRGDRQGRPGGSHGGDRPRAGGSSSGGSDRRSSSGGRSGERSEGGRPADNRRQQGTGGRGGKSGGGRSQGGRPQGAGGDRPWRERPGREERSADQKIYDGPDIPDDISAKDLDKHARQALQGLPEKLAERVSRHLVMAGLLMASDPETAYLHALAAKARANRNALIREACGETAYAAGKFSEALAEFRAAKRLSGQQMYAPMMADCERALRRPEKALAYDTADVRKNLDDAGNIELSIVIAGARRDLGQVEAAIRLLETEPLSSASRAPWVARLRYAYADALAEAGRREEAVEWFHRTVAVDGEKATDAEERVAELE